MSDNDISIDSDNHSSESSYQFSDNDREIRHKSTKHKKKVIETNIPNDLNDWTANSKEVQNFIIRRFIDKEFRGLKLYVIPLRSSKNNVETYYLTCHGWKPHQVNGKRILHFIKDIVTFKDGLEWDNQWEISIRKIRYNYNSSKYYNENSTLMKKCANGEIYKWITNYDLENNSIYIIVSHPNKTKKQILESQQSPITSENTSKTQNYKQYKQRSGQGAAKRSHNQYAAKLAFLKDLKEYIEEKQQNANKRELKQIQSMLEWMNTHGNIVWSLTQKGSFKKNFSKEDAYQLLLKRVTGPSQPPPKRKPNRITSRVNKKDLNILKTKKDIILISDSSSAEKSDSNPIQIKKQKLQIMKHEQNIKLEPPKPSPPKQTMNNNNQQLQQTMNNTNNQQLQSTMNNNIQQTMNNNIQQTFTTDTQITVNELSRLNVGDAVDYRDGYGRFILCQILRKKDNFFALRFDSEYYGTSFDEECNYVSNANNFARSGSISRRPSHKGEINKYAKVKINPLRKHPGWRVGQVRNIDPKSGQVQVLYHVNSTKNALYWAHLDNSEEMQPYFQKKKNNIQQLPSHIQPNTNNIKKLHTE
eukprot:71025_1